MLVDVYGYAPSLVNR